VTNAKLANSSLTITAGTGLTGGGSVALGASVTVSLAATGVTSGAYGDFLKIPQLSINAQGQVTAAANLTIPNFLPSGGSAMQGLVPSPGAAAFPSTLRALTDQATWAVVRGQVLGNLYVAANESTSSSSPVFLTTHETFNFTLDQAQTVLIEYGSTVFANSATASLLTYIYLGATLQTSTTYTTAGTGSSQTANLCWSGTLAAGTYTVNIYHATQSGATGNWSNRNTRVTIVM
jgi:hypothetical protein